jgi:DNA-binding response OmpR family regulator
MMETAKPAATLVVEDDQPFAESLRASLLRRGFLTDLATTWEDGLAAFRIGGHELIIADYNLPGSTNGLQLLAEAKLLVPSCELILMSGALSPNAERLAGTTRLITAFLRKTPTLASDLAPYLEAASARAREPTDWRAFAAGFISDLGRDHPDVGRIDEVLRKDVDPRG